VNIVRRHLRFANWLALVAMLALSLLPTVSHALAHPGSGFVEVCTPQGMKLVALADGEKQPSNSALHLEHCGYCSASFNAVVMPALPPALPQLQTLGTQAPPLFLQAPRTLFAWRSAQPRGPPFIS
jgi:hypothetical protein